MWHARERELLVKPTKKVKQKASDYAHSSWHMSIFRMLFGNKDWTFDLFDISSDCFLLRCLISWACSFSFNALSSSSIHQHHHFQNKIKILFRLRCPTGQIRLLSILTAMPCDALTYSPRLSDIVTEINPFNDSIFSTSRINVLNSFDTIKKYYSNLHNK